MSHPPRKPGGGPPRSPGGGPPRSSSGGPPRSSSGGPPRSHGSGPPRASDGPRPPGQRFGGGPRPAEPQRPANPQAQAGKPASRAPVPSREAPGPRPFSLEKRPARAPAAPHQAEPRAPAGPRTPETPRGAVWLYGMHAVDAALGNPNRRLRRLILTEEAEAALVARHKLPWPLTPERSDRARIDLLLGRDAVHQGMALLADPLGTPLLAAVLERPGPVIVLDQVSDPRNVGAVLRSAAAFGACCVITQDRNAPEETGALAKAASGALETVPLIRAVNLARTLVALKAAGLWTVGLDSGGAPLSGPALAERRVALVLGAEGPGMRRLVRETCDEVAGLAMPGSMESLNVSAAATVALYELARR